MAYLIIYAVYAVVVFNSVFLPLAFIIGQVYDLHIVRSGWNIHCKYSSPGLRDTCRFTHYGAINDHLGFTLGDHIHLQYL